MALKATCYILEKKSSTLLICMIGISAVAYGMLKDNNLIFIIGMLCVIGGYLLIRRKIGDSTDNNP